MWPLLPKDCNCNETPTSEGKVCNNTTYTSDDFYYKGPNSSCGEVQNHDDISTTLQKIENFLCNREGTKQVLTYIQNNIQEFPEFVTLVNTTLACNSVYECFVPQSICFTVEYDCESGVCTETHYITPTEYMNGRPYYTMDPFIEVIYNNNLNRWECWYGGDVTSYLNSNLFYPAGTWVGVSHEAFVAFSANSACPTTTTTSSSTTTTSTSTSTTTTSSSTTTTTTTEVPACKIYTLQADIENGSWNAVRCDNETETGGILFNVGNTVVTPCIHNYSLSLSGVSILNENVCPTTTTTSSTSTSTTTSTTSTTTTLYPCSAKKFLVVNNTGNTVNDIYATGWTYTGLTPVGPYTPLAGIQNGTNNAITVEINPYVEQGSISLYVNTVLIQTINFYYSGTYTFNPTTIGTNDCVWILINL